MAALIVGIVSLAYVAYRVGWMRGHASAERSAARNLGEQMKRWKSGDVVKNRNNETLDLSGVKERAKS